MLQLKIELLLASKPDLGGGFQYSRCVLDALLSEHATRKGLNLHVTALDEGWLKGMEGRSTLPHTLVKVPLMVQKIRGLCIRRNMLGLWKALRTGLSPLTRHIKRSAPHLVISPCQSFLCVDSPYPVLAPIHDLMYIYEPRFPEVAGSSGERRLAADRAVTNECAGILVDSTTGARHVADQFGVLQERLKILPFCVHRPVPAVPSRPSCSFPARFVFYPAQLWSHKNHAVVLRAVALLKESGLSVHCVFCGAEKNSGGQLRESIAALGLGYQVTLLGLVADDELSWLYSQALAMVMPSFFGPTNIPPLEAMSFGCPVLAADVYAVREQLGDAACYFRPDDHRTLARHIRDLCTDEALRRGLVEQGRQRLPRFSHQRFTEGLVDIVENLTVTSSNRRIRTASEADR